MSDIKAAIILFIFILSGYLLSKIEEYDPTFKYDSSIMLSAISWGLVLISIAAICVFTKICSYLNGSKEEKPPDIKYYTNDLYFIRTNENNESIHYQIKNNIENGVSWSGCCILNQGEYYSFSLDTDRPIEVIQNNHKSIYKVKEEKLTLGEIVFIDSGFIFKNNEEIPVYKAMLETTTDEGLGTVGDFLLSLELGNSYSSSITSSNFIIKNQKEEIVAKYYVPLKNLDLSFDQTHHLDIRIAAVFGMIFDIMIHNSLKGMPISENK